jgi:hypothetical protein
MGSSKLGSKDEDSKIKLMASVIYMKQSFWSFEGLPMPRTWNHCSLSLMHAD